MSRPSFTDKVQKHFSTFKKLGNPFQEESPDLLTFGTKNIAHPSAAKLIKTQYQKCKAAFREFSIALVMTQCSVNQP